MGESIIIGSRGSDLALWQANFLREELLKIGIQSEIKIIKTQGDKIQNISLEKLEGKGFFTKEIEDALLENVIDIAVHSHKDLPTELTPGLMIAAVSHREDPSELLLIRKDAVDNSKAFELKENAIIGTSSARRMVQMKFFRPDVVMKDIRGNVPTRIEKLRSGNYNAILLAAAGVKRLQLDCSDLHEINLPATIFIPAPAQGVLAFQCRRNDEKTIAVLKQLNHADVVERIFIEREVMRLFQGGCHMPLGVFCKKENSVFRIWTAQAADKSDELKRLYLETDNIEAAPVKIFHSLQKKSNRSVFISSNGNADSPFIKLLTAKGFNVQAKSLLNIQPVKINSVPSADWLFFTSKNGVQNFFSQVKNINYKIAAVGEETATCIKSLGYAVDFTGYGDNREIAATFLRHAAGSSVLFPQAETSADKLFNLIGREKTVIKLVVYKNEIISEFEINAPDILVFTSPMNVDAYLHKYEITEGIHIIAIGNTTKEYLHSKGIQHVMVPPFKNLMSVADLICGLY